MGRIKPDTGGVETVLCKEIRAHVVFPEGCTVTERERVGRGGPALLTRGTIKFQEVVIANGRFSQLEHGRKWAYMLKEASSIILSLSVWWINYDSDSEADGTDSPWQLPRPTLRRWERNVIIFFLSLVIPPKIKCLEREDFYKLHPWRFMSEFSLLIHYLI